MITKQQLENYNSIELWNYWIENDSNYALELLQDRYPEDYQAYEKERLEEERGLNQLEDQRQSI